MAGLIETECPTGHERRSALPGTPVDLAQAQMTVRDILNPNVITTCPSESILAASRQMCSHDVSCVVVVDGGAVAGIFTQKDLLQSVALEHEDWLRFPVAERMSSPVVTAPPELPVLEASQILKSKHIKHLPIVAEQRLVGIVTQTDVTRALIYLTPLQSVREVMSRNVATVSVEATAAEAARMMWFQNISCVVVMSVNEPVGLVSQTDILMRVILPRKDAAGTPISEVMSSPVLPIPPDYSVFTASRIMDKMHIHRLVVRDGRQVCGIVSQTDVLQAVERRLAEEEECRPPAGPDMPVFTLDLEGVITCRNAAFLRLLDCAAGDEILGASFLNAALWAGPRDENLLRQTLRRGRSDLLRLTVRTGPQAAQPILLLLAALKNDTGEIIGWQGAAWRRD
jgi:CBS domain-containing protein